MNTTKDLFEELSVTELEERLELANRCLCRVGAEDVAPKTPATPATPIGTTTGN